MKRDEKQQLLSGTTQELKQKLGELQAGLVRNRQERRLQDRSQIDIKSASKTRKTVKMIKTELRRRELEGATQE